MKTSQGPVFSAVYLCDPEEIRCDTDLSSKAGGENPNQGLAGAAGEGAGPLGNRDVVFLRLPPCCLGSALTGKVFLAKNLEVCGQNNCPFLNLT